MQSDYTAVARETDACHCLTVASLIVSTVCFHVILFKPNYKLSSQDIKETGNLGRGYLPLGEKELETCQQTLSRMAATASPLAVT